MGKKKSNDDHLSDEAVENVTEVVVGREGILPEAGTEAFLIFCAIIVSD